MLLELGSLSMLEPSARRAISLGVVAIAIQARFIEMIDLRGGGVAWWRGAEKGMKGEIYGSLFLLRYKRIACKTPPKLTFAR